MVESHLTPMTLLSQSRKTQGKQLFGHARNGGRVVPYNGKRPCSRYDAPNRSNLETYKRTHFIQLSMANP